MDDDAFAALQEAATRSHKTLDEIASEAVMAGLKNERKRSLQDLFNYGHRKGEESGICEEDLPELIHQWRKEWRNTRS